MTEQWQVDIARSESDRNKGRVEVAAYTSIGFDRRTVALVDCLEDARQIVADHNAASATDRAELEALLDRAGKMLYRLGRKLDGQDGWYDMDLRDQWIGLVNQIAALAAQDRPAAAPAERREGESCSR